MYVHACMHIQVYAMHMICMYTYVHMHGHVLCVFMYINTHIFVRNMYVYMLFESTFIYLGTVHWFCSKTSFHPLLWTSSGLKGS